MQNLQENANQLVPFVHLHVHTQFSLLDGAASIPGLMKKAKADGMKAIALTDHGNMFGAFKFVAEADKYNLKPIVGCEFYLVKNRHQKEFSKHKKDERFHQLLLAKNPEGYKNLTKLCSLGFIEGLYSKYPRIDKEILVKYHHGLIATSCCIGAEIPQTILKKGENEAEKLLQWWIDLFGEDYYIELQRHNLKNIDNTGISQEDINQILLKWAKKYNLKVIATNDSHYINEEDWNAHDILLCINTSEKKATPIGEGKGFRFGFPNSQFYFKTQAEMNQLFADIPFALENTLDIVEKVEKLKLKRDVLLPNYQLPEGFTNQHDYLRHLTFLGASKRYGSISPEIEQRLNYELGIIEKMGFSGYFLIVQDFINAAIAMGVKVGLGRGSAAGSAVAYCIGITNIDPIKYDLLFERFLNPERVSMPDIDTDFDDVGRQKVIDYVVEKYGRNQVAQLITYGTMAAKMAVKDVARVLDLPLEEANRIAKLIPEKPGIRLEDAINESPELREIFNSNDIRTTVLKEAKILEGSVRNTGIHAAGVIIAPDDLTNYIPVCTSKDTNLLVTQYDGKVIEEAGMLKMDFLGLKTLTILKDALALIKKNHGIEIDLDKIPLDDPKTYQLYQRGDTIGTFQFESEGMQTYLRQLKPTNIEDLIAMNALYRPGPLAFIPIYIDRKHGREQVEYPHELLKPILEKTYGIMVYQEQIMQTAQILAGYTLGEADLLRRAMGKKDKEKMAKERVKFVEGAEKLHQIPKAKAEEIFDIMERFAEYGFNRSHSAAYSVLAYQTAYLKANYTPEYMAAVLSHNMDIEKITSFIEETLRLGVQILGPDVNESEETFTVNTKGQIRFSLAAIKGTGEAAVREIIRERNQNGLFKDIFDFIQRVNLRTVNKKILESLAQAGAFDCFKIHRATYFQPLGNEGTFIELLIKFGNALQQSKDESISSLFGGRAMKETISTPKIPDCKPWSRLEQLEKEKEVVGFYISGHPLDNFRAVMKALKVTPISKLDNSKNLEISLAGVVTKSQTKTDKNGNAFTSFTLEDFTGSKEITLWREEHKKFAEYVQSGAVLLLKGKYQPCYGSTDRFELKVIQIQDLEELQEQKCKGILLNVDILKVDNTLVINLKNLIEQYAGKYLLKVQLLDYESQMQVEMASRQYKVSLSETFMQKVAELGLEAEIMF
ncbi:MAG: DNA polymerase III subunit alpha [Microscillaceae bacterium]|nr:DNA polymerase III subunit alpha [Microscillaceae bacterium]MDW8460025.1 DNA polymerase III subunit alpha [Cytophagales bacterium]